MPICSPRAGGGRAYAARLCARPSGALGAVDFDDLIRATVELLDQPGMGEWVRYKLDQATEHVLIDEAQDTNPQQWAIVARAGRRVFRRARRARRRSRTLFTVGDYKQAIFGFQGTEPAQFRARRERHFAAARERSATTMPERRSRAAVRAAVADRTASARPGRCSNSSMPRSARCPSRGWAIGEVERARQRGARAGRRSTLWPPVVDGAATDEDDEEGWVDDATRALATQIARQIKALDRPSR